MFRPIADLAARGELSFTFDGQPMTARAGDTVAVSGLCKESVLFTPALSGIILDGQGKATLQCPPHDVVPTRPSDFTVFILGRDVRITGFTILGGSHAVHLSGPATAVIDKNVIRQSAGAIHIDKGSVGTIFDNVIEGNRSYGINLIENSYARIGFRIPTLPKPQPNIIRHNDGPVIIVGRWSSAWVVGNQITNNKGHGVSPRPMCRPTTSAATGATASASATAAG